MNHFLKNGLHSLLKIKIKYSSSGLIIITLLSESFPKDTLPMISTTVKTGQSFVRFPQLLMIITLTSPPFTQGIPHFSPFFS